jgi:DNA primase
MGREARDPMSAKGHAGADGVLGEDVVERVRQASDIVDLIGAYVDLRPAGRSHKARCPFHREKTPSFHVSHERQLFHCFGCGAGGDVFTFLMKHEGLSFPEALELLARRAGISLPERGGPDAPDRGRIIAALRLAVRYYRGKLKGRAGAGAREYLEGRGIPASLLDAYYVGFAPAGGQAFLDYARKEFSADVLVQAGLLGQSEGRLYDRFRDRIAIPILSVAGEPIGFGARTMHPNVEPKYLNSPETAVYHKSRVLFGLPQAREAIRDQGRALIVEGYFDVLALVRAGHRHAVAPCGTAWTPEHVRLLLRYTRNPVFVFDGDAAGEQAAWRALEVTLPLHPDVGVVALPAGQDPDDLVRQGQVDLLQQLLGTPLSPVAFAHDSLARQGVDGHPRIARLAELLARVENVVAREMMVDEAAGLAHIPTRVLRQEVERLVRERPAGTRGGEGAAAPTGVTIRLLPLEEAILKLVQAEPAAAGVLREAALGAPAVRAAIREVLFWVDERSRSGLPPQAPELLRRIQVELGEGIDVGFLVDQAGPVPDEAFRDELLRRLRDQALENEIEAVGREIRALESQGENGDRLAGLLRRKQDLARDLARLRGPR